MNKIYFLIGASGAGKSTILNASKNQLENQFDILHFDNIGVPSFDEMQEQFGSIEEWQRVKTIEWIEEIKKWYLNKRSVILDAQTRPSFIKEGCLKFGVDFEIILFDCSDDERKKRLIHRHHEELADQNMMNWAAFLRKECKSLRYKILDNTGMTVQKSVDNFVEFLCKD